MSQPGPKNLITDVDGIRIGNTHNAEIRTGVTVLLPDEPSITAVDIRGGGPGTRETTLLDPKYSVERTHGLVLSGGSAFGLDAATGVQSYLKEQGKGFPVGGANIPIVPQAILFDMLNGGNKDWGRRPPFQDMAYEACQSATDTFKLGTIGAGFGATTLNYKGGLGSASFLTEGGIQVGAIVAVNAAGSTTIGDTKNFWAAPFELNNEFGGLGSPSIMPDGATEPKLKGMSGQNTTIAIVATNVALTPSEAQRFAIMAQTGLSHAIYPAHTPLDGDIVFSISTEKIPLRDPVTSLAKLGTWGANTLARAIARAIYEATPFTEQDSLPCYRAVLNTNRDITGK